jgi:hypothetical protein
MAYDPHIIGCITPKHLVHHAFCTATCLSSLETGRLNDTLLHISCISAVLNTYTLTIQSAFLFFANSLPAMMCPLLHYVQVIVNTTRCSPVYPSALCVLVIRLAVRSMARACGSSRAGIACSDPAGAMDVCLLSVLCVVRQGSLRRADCSSRRVLPSVVRLSVIVKPL